MENEKLHKIRHFKGSLQDLIDYWEEKGVDTTPYKNVDYEYPTKKKERDNSIPYQTFDTKTFKTFESFVNEKKEKES